MEGTLEEKAFCLFRPGGEGGKGVKGGGQSGQIPRRGGLGGELRRQPIKVVDSLQLLPELLPKSGLLRGLLDRVEPGVDERGVEERPKKPLFEPSRPHGSHRLVNDPEEAPLLLAGSALLEELQSPLSEGVEDHVVLSRVEAELFPLRKASLPHLGEVVGHGAGGGQDRLVLGDVHLPQGGEVKALLEEESPLIGVEGPGFQGGDQGVAGEALFLRGPQACRVSGEEELPGVVVLHLLAQGCVGRRLLGAGGEGLPCGQVEGEESPTVAVEGEGEEEDVLRGGFELQRRARGKDLEDLPADDLAPPFVLFELLADGHLPPRFQELADVELRGVVGKAAHRDGVILVPVPGGEGDLENPGTFGGVVEEELVKISHPEEEDGILVLLLRLQVLPHYGSVGFHRV